MKKFVLLLATGLASVGLLVAQEPTGVCGTSLEDQLQSESRLLENIEKANSGAVTERGAIQYVPIFFHLVGDAQGEGKVKEAKVLDQLCALNAAYEPMEIRFYLSPHPTKGLFNYSINATNVYSNQNAWLTMQSNRHANALNVFIVDQAVSGNNQQGVTLAYYTPARDWVVSRRDQISGSTKNPTIPHEIGHFFSLAHPFLGWESNYFDSSDPSWPVAPILSPGGVPTEKMDGSNCQTAGDKVCDTPSDYAVGFGYPTCNYQGGAKDPNGVLITPMENNMMSYFDNCNSYAFTPQQQSIVLADLASPARNYLDNNFTPAATEINTPADLLVSPAQGETVPYYDEVLLEWQAVPGATYYLLEMDIVTTYASAYSQTYIVNTNSKLVTSLLANRNYYWRVRPFNEYVTCATARQRSFKTPLTSGTRNIEGLTALQLAPNPVRDGASVNLYVQAENSFEANIRVIDIAGRQVYEQLGVSFPEGENRFELPLNNLDNGLYMVVLQSREGQAVRKLSVLK